MAGVQVSREDDRFFYLQAPSGKELPVAKRGLSKERQEVYRSQIAPAPINGMQSTIPENDFTGDAAFDVQQPPERLLMPSQLSRQQAPEVQPDPLQGMSASVGGPVPGVEGAPQGLGLAQPELVPAVQTVQQDMTPGVKLSPTIKKDIQEGFQKRAEAAIAQQEAANSFKEGFAKANVELNTKLQEVESKYDLIQKNRDEAIGKVQTEYQDLTRQFDEAKIDPNRIYGGSTSKRVMAGLAIALGEIGRAMTGGSTNAALKIINDAINRDIAAQQSEISRIGQRATMARQMMADIDDRFDDKIAATNMKRAILLDQAERKALELSKNLKTDLEIAQAQDFIAQLQNQKADALAKVEQIEADKATIRTTTQLMSPAGVEGKKAEKTFDQAQKLRSEYNKNPVTLETIKRQSSLNNLEAAKEMDSAGGDLAFIFSYMKMLDPGSVVREGEFANAQNAAGVPDRIRNLYNKAIDGKRLNPEQRDDFFNTAKAIYQKQMAEQRKVDKRYEGLSKRAGIDPIDVIVQMEPEDLEPNEMSSTFVPSGRR